MESYRGNSLAAWVCVDEALRAKYGAAETEGVS